MNFIPVLAQSQCGQYVTIQPTIRAVQPFLDAKSEVRELINHLQSQPDADRCNDDDDDDHSLDTLPFRPALKLSAIVLSNAKSPATDHSPDDLSLSEVAHRVITGIRTESPMLSVNAKRSRIELSWRKVRRFLGRS